MEEDEHDPAPSAANPDQLPVGFTRHFDARIGEDVLDITCAACHTGEIHFRKDGRTSAMRIDVTSAYVTGLRTNGNQGSYSIYYDTRTPVYYQGQSYSPSALERGDQIDVRAIDNGSGRYMADQITVTRNVRQ